MIPDYQDNPNLYRKMNEPFATAEEANAAINKFHDGVKELRKECRIAHVVAEVSVSALSEDGEMLAFGSDIRLGNGTEHEALAARLLGTIQQWRKEMIGRLLAGGK